MSAKQIDLGRLVGLIVCVALGLFAWDVAALKPFKILVVAGHETGHAVASWLVGGSVARITLAGNESGACLSSIPPGFFSRVVVYSGGYVGSAVIASMLLLLSFRFGLRRPMLVAASVWLLLVGIFFGRDLFTLGFCAAGAVAFGLGAKYLPEAAVGSLNLFIATFTGLYALIDLKDDLWNGTVRAQSDAGLLAGLTPIPAIVWAFGWTVLSTCIVAYGTWIALQKQEKKGTGYFFELDAKGESLEK